MMDLLSKFKVLPRIFGRNIMHEHTESWCDSNPKQAYVAGYCFGNRYYLPISLTESILFLRSYFKYLILLDSAGIWKIRRTPNQYIDFAIYALDKADLCMSYQYYPNYAGNSDITAVPWAAFGSLDSSMFCLPYYHYKKLEDIVRYYNIFVGSSFGGYTLQISEPSIQKLRFLSKKGVSMNALINAAIRFLHDIIINCSPEARVFLKLFNNSIGFRNNNAWAIARNKAIINRPKNSVYKYGYNYRNRMLPEKVESWILEKNKWKNYASMYREQKTHVCDVKIEEIAGNSLEQGTYVRRLSEVESYIPGSYYI